MLHIGDRVQNKDGKISYIVQLYSNKDVVLVGFEGTNVIKQYTTKQFLSGEPVIYYVLKRGRHLLKLMLEKFVYRQIIFLLR